MRRFAGFAVIVVGFIALTSSTAHAQASIAGVVKDVSGAVLPGVTVEAASPALIEKTRSVISDGSGLYRIEDLRPGTYTVTFTLVGFNTTKREGIELTGSFTAAVNIEMKLGSVEETITVSGEAPIVDLQSATPQRVMDSKVLAEIPTGRVFANYAILIPGVGQTTSPDVGGSLGANMTDLVAHGSRASDFRMMVNGVSLSTNAGGRAGAVPNINAYQEVAVDVGAVDASQALGGPRINFIPRDGGNVTRGTGFFGFANSSFQSNNLTQRLQDQGLTSAPAVSRIWDFNPGIGGPIQQDKLWYYFTYRNQGAYNTLGGLFVNKNANNPNAWTYDPDLTRPEVNNQLWADEQLRLTYQASPRNKLALSVDFQDINDNPPFGCNCLRGAVSGGSLTLTAHEANTARRFPLQRSMQADWTSPVTSRLLLEAVAIQRVERFVTDDTSGGGSPLPLTDKSIISVTEQGGLVPGLTYRAPATYGNTFMWTLYYRTAVSYVTGSHSLKFGTDAQWGHNDAQSFTHVPYSYRFKDGVPNQITMRVAPTLTNSGYGPQVGVYAQDKWTRGRLTAGYGLRYDHFGATIRENSFQPTPLAPNLNLSFPEEPGLSWNDLNPKLSAVYDVFGTGKTAIKTSLNRYVSNQTNFTTGGQFTNVVTSTTRGWTDNGAGGGIANDFVPQCDLTNLAKNGECNAATNTGFGTFVQGSSTRDPSLNSGWFHRPSNWEFSLGVQHEILPRVSVEVSYFRRWYGNFTVTDNTNVSASDFTQYSVTAPVDSRLPGGGGYVINGLYDLNPNKFGQPALNNTTFSDTFGNQTEHWNGVDFSVNARLHNGMLLQGGASTGRTVTDNCEIIAQLPEVSPSTPSAYCHVASPFLTQVKLLGAYTIPRFDVLVSGTYQSIPGPELAANRTYSNAEIKPSLIRDLSAGTNANVTVNLIPPASMYGERVNQIDFRVGKVLKAGRARATVSFDVYNLTNADTVINENSTYTGSGASGWRVPTEVIQARLAKISVQWDF